MNKNFYNLVAIDEVGRGAIAGPLVVGGLMIDKTVIKVLRKHKIYFFDSKLLTQQQRLYFVSLIKKYKLPYKTYSVNNQIIDKYGIQNAFTKAIIKIYNYFQPQILLIDGLKIKNLHLKNAFYYTKGDQRFCSIAGASILAKVKRDRYMINLAKKYPFYAFEKNKGYGTKEHYCLLQRWGISKIHRLSFLKNFKIEI
ncbi:MAG: ribonuclease HII [Candidatus Parcubacteria bacterium]|nr:MAG: ribonuclease HII [Candidatus Parcubacteria bacterium]